MTTKTRLYRVKQTSTGAVRLIEAATARGAVSHAASQDFQVDTLDQIQQKQNELNQYT